MSFSRLSLQIFSDDTSPLPGLGQFQSAMNPRCGIPQHVLAAGLDVAVPPAEMNRDSRSSGQRHQENQAPLAFQGFFQNARILAKRHVEGERNQTLTFLRMPFHALSKIPRHSVASYLRCVIDFCSTLAF